MSAAIDRRLTLLETRASAEADGPRLILIGRVDKPDSDIVGIRASGPRLSQDVVRLAGESIEALQARATALVQGAGPLAVLVHY